MAARRTFRRVLWAPPHLFPADAAALLGLSASPPPYETGDVRTWRDSLPELDAQVASRYGTGSVTMTEFGNSGPEECALTRAQPDFTAPLTGG
jgi:hypothetical protein